MKTYEVQYKNILSQIIKDYRELCKYIAFNNEKAKATLLTKSSVKLNFNDLTTFQKVELAEKTNEANFMNLKIDKSFLAFDDADDWTISLDDNKDDNIKNEFIELIESWSLNIDLPRYVEEVFLNDAFEERFEGILYLFFNELITDFNFADDIRRTYFKTILDKIKDTLSHYDSVLLKPKNLPPHLLQTFVLLKNEYQKAYKLIFKEFQAQLGAYYHFENHLTKNNKSTTIQTKNYFTKCEKVVINDSKAKNLRSSLVSKKLISDNTSSLTLKNAFSGGSPTKINWLGGKDQLGCFIKLLKDEKIIKGQAHFVAKNIFTVNGNDITSLRTPPTDETLNYVEMLKGIIRDSLLPSTSK